MLSHKNIYIATLNTVISLGANKDSTAHPAVLPIFHITAELFALVSLHLGAKTVLLNGFNPVTVLALIESEKLEFAILLPLMWKAMLGCAELNNYDYSSMQLGMYGMAPMDSPTLEKLSEVFDCPFITGSGQTEINGIATVMDSHWVGVKEGNIWGDGSIASDQAVMDDQGNLLAPGEIGEVVWRSPQVMLAYYRNDEATHEAPHRPDARHRHEQPTSPGPSGPSSYRDMALVRLGRAGGATAGVDGVCETDAYLMVRIAEDQV